jgi:nucleoside-diphosphate-sugar epimerase
MTPQRVLYVGGTGTISWSCVRRSLAAGTDVSVLNRGMPAGRRPLPGQVNVLRADIRDRALAPRQPAMS